MINLCDICLMRGQTILLKSVSCTLPDKARFALVGNNGSGKTSLFSLLLGNIDPVAGSVTYQGTLRFAHVAQELSAFNGTALDYVLSGDTAYWSVKQKIDTATKDNEDLAAYYADLTDVDGYTAPARAAKLLSGLGFSNEQLKQKITAFSGGWQMRLNLARAMHQPSDVLLLDEPTNHLDLEAIIWLEQWLSQYKGLLLVISHDRDFLDETVNHVLHLENQNLTQYTGGYTQFERQRVEKMATQAQSYQKQQEKVKHLTAYVDRFRYKASKAKQAQSRIKALERLKTVSAVSVDSPFAFDFLTPKTVPFPLVTLDAISLGYNNHLILKDIHWQLAPGDRIALLGANGAGKSTLIKALIGDLAPISGLFYSDKGVSIGYFAQHQLSLLNPSNTALAHMLEKFPKSTPLMCRNHLGRFGFLGDKALSAVENFSGGEKARLVLAMIVWSRPNLLLLDEPTNHLDITMRNALSLALQSFEGALILVSHDRYLIKTTVDHLYLVDNQSLSAFDGDLTDYKNKLLSKPVDKIKKNTQNNLEIKKQIKKNKKKSINPIKLQHLEEKMKKIQLALSEIEPILNDPALYEASASNQREALYQKQKKLQIELESAENDWLEYQEE